MEQVFGYVRVSSETQAEKGYGASVQEEAIRKHCQNNGLELKRIYRDLSVSGTAVDRSGLTDMLAEIQSNGVRRVVVLNTSRLWRSDRAKVIIHKELKRVQADVISVEQPTYSIYSSDPNEFLVNGMMELLDQYERMAISIKLAKGRRAKAKQGDKPAGVAPLGYRYQGKTLEVDPAEAQVVKDIFRIYLQTESIAGAQSYLKSNGVKTRRGNDFSAQVLADILSNRFYVGELEHGDVKRQGNHEALISKVTFGKVQALKERNRKR